MRVLAETTHASLGFLETLKREWTDTECYFIGNFNDGRLYCKSVFVSNNRLRISKGGGR
jgi:hypothetical protein